MSFQTQISSTRTCFHGTPVRKSPIVAARRRATATQVKAKLGPIEALPLIFEAAKIGFAYAAIPAAIKGALDARRGLAEPSKTEPQTTKKPSQAVVLTNQVFACGLLGAVMGSSVGVYTTQFDVPPAVGWPAGIVTGLALWAAYRQVTRDDRSGSALEDEFSRQFDGDTSDIGESDTDSDTEQCDESRCDVSSDD